MGNFKKWLRPIALASVLLPLPVSGVLLAGPVRPGYGPDSPRRSLTIPGQVIDFPSPGPAGPAIFPAARFQPVSSFAGADQETEDFASAKDLLPTPTPVLIVGGSAADVPTKTNSSPSPTNPPTPPPSPTPTLTPEGYKTPPPTPTPLPSDWVSPGTLSPVYYLSALEHLFRYPKGEREISVTSPDGTRARRTVVERKVFSPRRKSFTYSLLYAAYRLAYWQFFDIHLTTPPPTATPTPEGYKTPTPPPTRPPTATPPPSRTPSPPPTPSPTPLILVFDSGDYDGDGTSDIAIFRPSSGLWAVRDVTRFFYGRGTDLPVSGDYAGDGTTDIAVFRGSSGLWAVRDVTRTYFGAEGDIPVPGDYTGDGTTNIAVFRGSSALWAIQGVTRFYFGRSSDRPVPAYYRGKNSKSIAFFRPSTGLWAIRGLTRIYFGAAADLPAPADYTGDEKDDIAVFRSSSGLWAVRGVTRAYFGRENDRPVSVDFRSQTGTDIGIFRSSSGLWAVRDVTRAYFGQKGDLPLGAPPCRPVPSPTPEGYKTPAPSPSPVPASFTLMTTIDARATTVWSLWGDEGHLYSGTDDGSIFVWERDGAGVFSFQTDLNKDQRDEIYGLSGYTAADPKRLYGASSQGLIQVWEYRYWPPPGGWVWQTSLGKDLVSGALISVAADSNYIFAAGADGNAYLWEADFSGFTVLASGAPSLYSASFDDYYFYAGGENGRIYLWDRDDFSLAAEFPAASSVVWATEVDEYYFYAGGSAPSQSRWSLGDFHIQTAPGGDIYDLSSDMRDYMFGVGQEGALYAWSAADFSQQTFSAVSSSPLYSVYADRHEDTAVNPRYIFAGSDDARIYVWWGDNPSIAGSAWGGAIPKAIKKPSPLPVESLGGLPAEPTATPTASPSPIPSATPIVPLGPGPGTFDLVGTIEVGPPVWSVWGDDRYLCAGTGDGSVYIWERGPDGFYFAGSVGGYDDGNIYGLTGHYGLFRRRLYGASENGSVYAWDFDLRTGGLTLLAVLDQGQSFMYSVAADRELICGANNDGGVYVWSASNFSLQTVLDRGAGPVLSVSLDEDFIYSSGVDGVVTLWDRRTFSPARSLSASDDIVWATAVDRSGLYAGGSAPALAGWSKPGFRPRTAESDPPGAVGSLSSDGRRYISGAGPDGSLQVWSAADFSLQTVSRASSAPLNSVFADRYRPGDPFPHFIYGGSADGRIYVWRGERTPTPTPAPTIPPTPSPAPSATPDGYLPPTPALVLSPPEGIRTPSPVPPLPPDRSTPPPPEPPATPAPAATARPVPSPTLGLRVPFEPTPPPAPSPAPSTTPADFTLLATLRGAQGWMLGVFADRDYIYGAGQDNLIYVWDRVNYNRVTTLTVPDCRAMLAVFADEDYIYAANDDSRIYVWDRENFGLRFVLGDGRYYMESVFADWEYLYGANYDGGVYLWDRPEFNFQTRLAGPRGWMNTVFADGERIYAGSGGIDHRVSLWDRSGLSLLGSLAGPSDDLNDVYSDGEFVYGASADGNVYLWEADSLRLLRVLSQPVNQVTSVIASGSFIYASSLDTGLYVWERDSLSLYRVLDEPGQPLQGMYAEGEQIFAAGRDGNVYVWQAPAGPAAGPTPDSGYPQPPLPPSRPDSGAVVKELSSLAAVGDRDGGIAWRDGYLYENLSGDNVLYRRDPFDGAEVGRISGLRTSRDIGIAWDSDQGLWYIADPWSTGISAFRESEPEDYLVSISPRGSVTGLFYDLDRRELISANNVQTYINVWSTGGEEHLRWQDRIEVGFPQGGVAAVGDRLWAGSSPEGAYAPVYELERDGTRTGRQFLLPEGRRAGDMAWDGRYLWVRSDYRHGSVKIYRVDINDSPEAGLEKSADSPLPAEGEGAAGGEAPPVPGDAGAGPEAFSPSRPLRSEFEWEPPAQPYEPKNKSLDYSQLQQTYRQTYWELFGIYLTTPTPPPTPIPTPTRMATATPVGYKTPVPAEGKVVINEIYWFEPENQWIELHNHGGSTVNLSGWRVRNETAEWTVNLSGSIDARGYFILYSGAPPDNKRDQRYDRRMNNASGDRLILLAPDGTEADKVDCSNRLWFAGGNRVSMERRDPNRGGSDPTNWANSTNRSGSNFWTPRAPNSVRVTGGAAASGGAEYFSDSGIEKSIGQLSVPNLSLWDYADWIDFETGRYFKIYGGDRADAGERAALYDYLPNAAFVYLATGYRPTGSYFRGQLLDLVRDESFDWGGEEHSRYIADLAESYLAVLHTGLFSEEERGEVREKFYRLALERRKLGGEGHYGQGIICGLNAVVGYLVGGERGAEMIDWANQLMSYDDTWTLPENSRHYGGIFLREMLRVALYSNRMQIPEADGQGRDWKRNFARQVRWIIETSPHNGYSPARGREYHPNHLGHYLPALAVATTVLDDGDPDNVRLAEEAKWLLQSKFNYGRERWVGGYGRDDYGYGSSQWGPFAILLNPVYLFWYLNDELAAVPPSAGSTVVYRPMLAEESPDGVYDGRLPELVTQPDLVIHRSGWGEDDLFLALDPAYPAAKSGENRYGFANHIISLSYGAEEFLVGVTANHRDAEKTSYNLADILSDYTGAELVNWEDNPRLSRSRTRVSDARGTWTRDVTLHKTGDRRIEVRDTLSCRGSVYWQFAGRARETENGLVLDVDGTRLEVTWEGAERAEFRDRTTWPEPDPEDRWTYSGPSAREVRLRLAGPGTVTTVFRGL